MAGFHLNSVTLSGGLTFDPELRTTPSGTPMLKLRMAYTEEFKDNATGEWQKRSNYIDVVMWGGVGRHLAGELRKGSQITVLGRLRWNEWTDTKTDQKRSTTEIIADAVFTGNAGGGSGGRSDFGPEPAPRGVSSESEFTPQGGSSDADFAPGGAQRTPPAAADDDIPF
jgi:single-strand DNA-binding protein